MQMGSQVLAGPMDLKLWGKLRWRVLVHEYPESEGTHKDHRAQIITKCGVLNFLFCYNSRFYILQGAFTF